MWDKMKYQLLHHDLLDREVPCFELDNEFYTEAEAIEACKTADKKYAANNNEHQWYSVFIPDGNYRRSIWDAKRHRKYKVTFEGYNND